MLIWNMSVERVNICGKGKFTKYYAFYEIFSFHLCIILRVKCIFVDFLCKKVFYMGFLLFLGKKGFDLTKKGFLVENE